MTLFGTDELERILEGVDDAAQRLASDPASAISRLSAEDPVSVGSTIGVLLEYGAFDEKIANAVQSLTADNRMSILGRSVGEIAKYYLQARSSALSNQSKAA